MNPMLDDFEHIAADLTYHTPTIPLVSNLTGRAAAPRRITTPAYWVRHVREAVRFADGVGTLHDRGVRHFIELGPDATLTTMAKECVPQGDDVTFVPLMHRDRNEAQAFLAALAAAHTHGSSLDWTLLTGTAPAAALPTYPFQRQSYWLEAPKPTAGAGGPGLTATSHPVLTTSVELPDGGGHLFLGRISASDPAWIPEHTVFGTQVLPGAAFVDLLLHAAGHVGCEQIEELTHHVFLAVPDRDALQLRVLVEAADESGRRRFTVYSRPEDAPTGDDWTRHATGALTAEPGAVPASADVFSDDLWPPAASAYLDPEEFYDRISEAGLGYGPLFRGLRSAWQDGDTLYAEVALPAGTDPGTYGIHPALLDAALQPAALVAGDGTAGDSVRVPFSWGGVSLYATGATALRVRIESSAPDTVSLVVADRTGAAVLTIRSLSMRTVGADQLAAVRTADTAELYGVDWLALPVPGDNDRAAAETAWTVVADPHNQHLASSPAALGTAVEVRPDSMTLPAAAPQDKASGPAVFVTWSVCEPGADTVRSVRSVTRHVLGLVQSVVADERTDSRLVVLTRGATTTGSGDESADLAGAAVWGLIRTAQSEHPGRFTLIDLDGSDASLRAVPAALATAEPQLAVRDGSLLVPRLGRIRTGAPVAAPDGSQSQDPASDGSEPDGSPVRFDTDRTVLVTGGTGALGRLLARHLVVTHGVRRLLLTSRRGAAAGDTLVGELAGLGAEVTIAACDVADRRALEDLLAGLPEEHPLGAVVHCAGTLDDGIVTALTPERFDAVLRPKVDGAWNLHRLTQDMDLDAFVLFSSV
ncbi:SDR family NAD(P)-dependent oxidoreductase, partial [Streptomyces sp. NPDC127119]|uniref:SDR family NAD(P)-dependent oxidoreductase n=1 Tax=Streptomyces sp. NPDC127119 TaxID=3345370 RepID=UPI00362CA94A